MDNKCKECNIKIVIIILHNKCKNLYNNNHHHNNQHHNNHHYNNKMHCHTYHNLMRNESITINYLILQTHNTLVKYLANKQYNF